jgi:hypothetical protein
MNMEMEKLFTEMRASLEKMHTGTLNREELDQLVENSRDFYERCVIVRYKAYEKDIFGEMPVSVPMVEVSAPETIVEIPQMMEIELEKEAIEDLAEDEMDDVLNFESEVLFEPEVEDTPEIEPEQGAIEFSLFDDVVEHAAEEIVDEEEAVEHVSISAVTTEEFGVKEEHVIMEQVSIQPTSEDNAKFVRRFSSTDPSLASQLSMTRLDTLIGSFGLNERLNFINGLFGGSSEAFSEAVKELDTQHSLQDALIKASAFAVQYAWDLDDETVEEFVIKLKRRHA